MSRVNELEKTDLEKHESNDECWVKNEKKGGFHLVLHCPDCEGVRIHDARIVDGRTSSVRFETCCTGIDPSTEKQKNNDCNKITSRTWPQEKLQKAKKHSGNIY